MTAVAVQSRMYTGLVETTGELSGRESLADGCRLRFETRTGDLVVDESISVSGVCLTAERVADGWFEAYLSSETVDRTYLADAELGTTVNIERPLSPDGQFDGHVVKGTVDTVTRLRAVERSADTGQRRLTFAVPEDDEQYLIEKGNVTLDGISLTVAAVDGSTFDVAVVPRTAEITTLSELSVGDPVHFEADLFAKYAERRADVETA